jgi:predicted transcriptional regulator
MKLTSEEERLRRESPAYRPDAGWEELERQAMSVVLSVRFDAAAARRVRQVAAALGRSPGGLIRDWTMERLGSASAQAELAAGVREDKASYHAAEDHYEALRQRYRPNRIDTLLVGESRPAGRTFFYLANSNLYYATHEAFQLALGPMPTGNAFLDLLRDRGVWLYDLADAPVDRMRGRPRRDTVRARASELVDLLRKSPPRLVIAVKKDLATTVRQAMEDAELDRDRLHVLPFPLYQWRNDFIGGLAALIGRQVDRLESLEDASDLDDVRATLSDSANRERLRWEELKARLEK